MELGNALLISMNSALLLVAILAAGAVIGFFAMFVVEMGESLGKSLFQGRLAYSRHTHKSAGLHR